nr:hypothetical protein ZC47.10 - Caenorhabditis elegans [Caenorhabditis elegans]
MACRKVCQSLRTAVNKRGANFNKLSVGLWRDRIVIDLDGSQITYSKSSLGESYVYCDFPRWENKFLREENYLNIAFNDLKILLMHASSLMIIVTSNDQAREHTVRSLVDVLQEEGNIHMETIRLHRDLSIDDMLLILPLFNSQTLRSIEFGGMTEGFPIQNVIKIRDDLLQRCTFQEGTIYVLKENFKPVEFARVFQPDYAGGDEFTLEYSNDNSKFGINFGDSSFREGIWKFEIKRCRLILLCIIF